MHRHVLLNFTRFWAFGFFRVYWVLKSNCIILNNLCAEGLREKVLNVVIFLESGSNGETGLPEKLKQSETVGHSRERPGMIRPKL